MNPTNSSSPRLCSVCHADISDRRSDATICGSKPCRNARGAAGYHQRLTEKPCNVCGTAAPRKRNEHTCPGCIGEAHRRALTTVEQTVTCRRCSTPMHTITKKNTHTATTLSTGLCDPCREVSKERQSEVKRGSSNPNWKGGVEPVRKGMAGVVARMRVSNPMHSPSVAARVRATKRHLIATGRLTYRRGARHHLWKGNREPSFVLRSRLLGWVKAVMARDGFRCTVCQAHRDLEVHHVTPFRTVVETCVAELGLPPLRDVGVNTDAFQKLSDLVVARHTLSDGITYCKAHHAANDSRRRP